MGETWSGNVNKSGGKSMQIHIMQMSTAYGSGDLSVNLDRPSNRIGSMQELNAPGYLIPTALVVCGETATATALPFPSTIDIDRVAVQYAAVCSY